MAQGPATPQEFYERCQNIFSIIMTYVSLHETVATTVEAKRSLYKKLTLQAYMRGLRDPLGARIRCMRPDTIEKALEYVHEEENTLYLQQRSDRLPERKMQSTSSLNMPKFSSSLQQPLALPPMQSVRFPPINIQGPSRIFDVRSPRPMPIWKPQMPLNRGPSRTQQMFSAPPLNYRPQSNIFRMPQAKNSYQPPTNLGPQPMSGVSHYVTKPFTPRTQHDWTKHGNPPPSNYFKTREMNINETYDPQYYDNYDDYYYPDYYEYPDKSYEMPYEQQQSYHSDYDPAYVEETQNDTPVESQDFQKAIASEKPR